MAYLVVDADGHCDEPEDGLAKWLPREYAGRAPSRVTDAFGYTHLMVEGRLASKRRWGGGPNGTALYAESVIKNRAGMRDPVQRLADMDEEGIDVAIIFGTAIALTVNGLADRELAAVLCHAVNPIMIRSRTTRGEGEA